MIQLRKAVVGLVCMAVCLGAGVLPCFADSKEPECLYAASAVVMEAETGRILYEKNGNEQRAMASTTKLMTLLIALENGDFETPVQVSARAAAQPDVHMDMREGETFSLMDLLYAMMLQSYNDAAVAIAEAVAGSVEEFCWMMNVKAAEVGAGQTNFSTVNGLDAKDHYSTAVDMARITRCVMQNPVAMEIMGTRSYTIQKNTVNSRQVVLENKNPLLNSYSGAIGGKTGFTAEAGLCLVGIAKRDDVTLITVVLGAGWPPHSRYRVSDCQKLFEYGFNGFYYIELPIKRLDTAEPVEVRNGVYGAVSTYIKEESFRYFVEEEDLWRLEYNLPYVMDAPIQKDQVLGFVSVYVDGRVVGHLDVCAAGNVEARDYWFYWKKLLDKILPER